MALRKGRGARAALIALETAGVIVALSAALALFLFWRLQSAPISLSLLLSGAEAAIERKLPEGYSAEIATALLRRADGDGVYAVEASELQIKAQGGEVVGEARAARFAFATRDLMRGKRTPRTIRIEDPVFRVTRNDEGRVSPNFAGGATADRDGRFVERLLGPGEIKSALRSAELVRPQIFFEDALSGRAWRGEASEARLTRSDGGYAARLVGAFDVDGKSASLVFDGTYLETTELITAEIDLKGAPLGDLLEVFLGPDAAVLASPLTGEASMILSRAGEIMSARLEGRAEGGVLSIAGRTAPVEFVDLVSRFETDERRFAIERLDFEIDGSKGSITGDVRIVRADDPRAPTTYAADLVARDIVLDTHGFLPEPLPIAEIAAKADYETGPKRLSFRDLRAELLDVALTGHISYAPGRDAKTGDPVSPEIKADLLIEGDLDPPRLLAAWPIELGAGARDFVSTRMPQGHARNIAFFMDLPAGAKAPESPMPDDAMRLTFEIINATAYYAPTMTPLTNGYGSARLTGNSFAVDNMRGRVGTVALEQGEVAFPALSPRGEPTFYRFTAKGAARDMLEVLNQPPLEVLKPTNLTPDRFSDGEATARVEVSRPNRREVPRDAYGYSGKATFSGLNVSEFYRGIDLAGAAGEIDLKTREMLLKGNADFGGAPIELEWAQRFFANDNRSTYKVSGVVDSTTGDVFGIPTRQFLRGPVSFVADATGDLRALETLKLDADFTRTALSIDALAWTKAAGAPAHGEIDLALSPEGAELRAARIVGEGIDLEGRATFDAAGALKTADFERVRLAGAADMSLQMQRTPSGLLDAALTGRYMMAGRLMQSMVEAGAPKGAAEGEPGSGLALRARFDALELRGGALFRDATLDYVGDARTLRAFSLSARTEAGKPISMVLKDTGAEAGPVKTIEARADDVGSLLTGVFGVTSIKNGEGSMELDINKEGGSEYSGRLEARNMRVVGAPLLARVFAAGSLTGLADLLNGQGIELSRAEAGFDFKNGVLTLSDARASGPSVGITAQGTIGSGESAAVDLHGAVAPAYQVNSFLGNAPLIGDLLINREGEGIVALSYDVNGQSDAPSVSVNPLSALAPGFLRRLFEGDGSGGGEAPETTE